MRERGLIELLKFCIKPALLNNAPLQYDYFKKYFTMHILH
jgi:hypothetical protein